MRCHQHGKASANTSLLGGLLAIVNEDATERVQTTNEIGKLALDRAQRLKPDKRITNHVVGHG